MVDFEIKKHGKNEFNGGVKYTDGDGVQSATINNAVENSLFASEKADEAYKYAVALTDAPDVSEAGTVGTPTVTMVGNGAYKKFKFANLKGENGRDGKDVLLYTSASITPSQGFYLNGFNHTPKIGETGYWICSAIEVGQTGDEVYIAEFVVTRSGYYNSEVVYYADNGMALTKISAPLPTEIVNTGDRASTGAYRYKMTFDNGTSILFPVTAIVGTTLKRQDADGNNVYSLDMSDGTSIEFTANRGPEGKEGDVGPQGPQGVSIESITIQESHSDGGDNNVNITLSDGTIVNFVIKNGSKGSQGEQGIQGEQGPKGSKGDSGADGTNGVDYLFYEKIYTSGRKEIGTIITDMDYADFNRTPVVGDMLFYLTQSIDAERNIKSYVHYGVITVANGNYASMRVMAVISDGATGATGPQGEKGEKGDKGDTALSVAIGTVTTAESGSDASVVNSGTDTDLVLDFSIPRGKDGLGCLYYTSDTAIYTGSTLSVGTQVSGVVSTNFNRTPILNESFFAVVQNPNDERTAYFKVIWVDQTGYSVNVQITSFISADESGGGSVAFNKYTLNVADTLAGRKRLYDVVTGAKGNVMLYSMDYTMPLSCVVYGTTVSNTKLYISGTKTTETSVTTLSLTLTSSGSMEGSGEFHSVQTSSGITFDKKTFTSNLRCVYWNDSEIV